MERGQASKLVESRVASVRAGGQAHKQVALAWAGGQARKQVA